MGIIKYRTHDYLTPDETILTVMYRIQPPALSGRRPIFQHHNDPSNEDYKPLLYIGSIRDEEDKDITAIIPETWKDAIEDELWSIYKSDINAS